MSDIDALIARMHQPGPVDDSPGGYERDDWLGQDAADRMADDAAGRYEKEMDAPW